MAVNILSVLAHPHGESFCGALFSAFNSACVGQSGSEIPLRGIDLYREEFDPILSSVELLRHIPLDHASIALIRELEDCLHLALFFPDWWGAEPAILKGFIDRLFRAGVVFARDGQRLFTQGGETAGLMQNCSLSLWITSDTPKEDSAHVRQGYTHRFAHIGNYCAFRSVDVFFHSPLRGSRLAQRRSWLEHCTNYAGGLSMRSKAAGRSSESK